VFNADICIAHRDRKPIVIKYLSATLHDFISLYMSVKNNSSPIIRGLEL